MTAPHLSYDEAERILRALPPIQNPAPPSQWIQRLLSARAETFAIEVGVAAEASLASFFLGRYPTDELLSAYEAQYPGLASNVPLAQRYDELLSDGDAHAQGLIHALRGKVFEFRAEEVLEQRFPGFDFDLAKSTTQPGWDLLGTGPDGAQILVQAKARAAEAVSDVADAMSAPDAPQFFVVTTELHDALVDAHPELADRLIDGDLSHLALDEDAQSALSTLAEHFDIDAPDSVADMLPYVGEVVLGVRLIVDIARNERTLAELPTGDRVRLHGVRALLLMARFGVSTVVTSAAAAGGGAVGSWFPGAGTAIGTVVGTIGGAVVAGKVNRRLEAQLLALGLRLLDLTSDDLFYYQNKLAIDAVGESLLRLRVDAERRFATPAA